MKSENTCLGQSVRSLQTMLRVIAAVQPDLPVVIPDGIYGPQTMNAVSAFQKKHGLPVTGTVNGETWDSIRNEYQTVRVLVGFPQKISVLMNIDQKIQRNQQWSYLPVMQAMLTVLSKLYPQIPAPSNSGILDEATASSLAAMQKYCGLPSTGVLGKLCWKHLALQFTANAARMERMLPSSGSEC